LTGFPIGTSVRRRYLPFLALLYRAISLGIISALFMMIGIPHFGGAPKNTPGSTSRTRRRGRSPTWSPQGEGNCAASLHSEQKKNKSQEAAGRWWRRV